MTPTQKELYNSKRFWQQRRDDQLRYFHYLNNMKFHWDGRYDQLRKSAEEVYDIIKQRLTELK